MSTTIRKELLNLKSAILACSAVILGVGCASVSTNLQSVSVSGPLHQPTVHLSRPTDEPGFRISPWLTVFGERERLGRLPGHSKVNAAGQYQIDTVTGTDGPTYFENPANTYTFNGRNFTWRLPTVSGGASFDVDVSESFSLFLGLGMTSVDNDALWSTHAGLGYSFGTRKISGRIEGALTWETVVSSAQFTRRIDYFLSDKTEVQFFSQESKRMRMGSYGALTLQSTGNDFVFYTQFVLGSQPVAWLSPSHGSSSQSEDENVRSLKFVSVTPGVAFPVGENVRLITGVRFTSDTEVSDTDMPFLIVPLAELEISF